MLNSFYFNAESVEFVFNDENLSDVDILCLRFSFDGNQSSSCILTSSNGLLSCIPMLTFKWFWLKDLDNHQFN